MVPKVLAIVLAVDLHHSGEGLKLVDGVHRRLGDVLGKRQGRGCVAILRHEAAVHLGFRREAFRSFVGDQLLQCGVTAPTGQHGVFAVDLLDQERLQEA